MDSCVNDQRSTDEYDYDSLFIKSKKYKTIGELKNAGLTSIIQTTARMEKSPERDYLDKWLYDTYYSKKKMYGSLTDRIDNISNKVCYREIMKRCFNNIDILLNHTSKQILSKETIDFITDLHSISASTLGSFIDYLMRRIISELMGKKFRDTRAGGDRMHVCNKPIINYTEKKLRDLKEICKDIYITQGTITKSLSKMSKEIMIQYLLKKQDKCKYSIVMQHNCILPMCQFLSYEKAQETLEYKTKDIIPDIFITSLFHAEAFGFAPQQEDFNKMYVKLTTHNNINDILITPLTEMCKELIRDKSDILLNPAFGGELDDIEASLPCDADLVVDDILIDIKCTKTSNEIKEITQLLGYSSLIMLNKNYRKKINKISIINILSGTISVYSIDFVNKENCVKYIKILTK